MAEPDEVEEDLFADLYDGDENAGSSNNAAAAPIAAQHAPSDTAGQSNDAPGYGEEPEIAYDPTSFDAEPSGQDHAVTSFDGTQSDARELERPHHEHSGINMKEDG
ncbi:hypothetical protein A1O1_03883 [Capronia coronata CBS 617.96]|uniref:Uncharacterized protein n=1 Tax=Capronia coronata CBS 617.96 TaxID=1182541 RepID=W9Z8C4_9EURO|nr:uncharacterized protein A1O1_03883 [Capronia coronata CBS 617.96]EXJ90779.1 hypothetical protein A1O1_03883 [Capronia coronata CBS 617.96]